MKKDIIEKSEIYEGSLQLGKTIGFRGSPPNASQFSQVFCKEKSVKILPVS